MGRLQAFWVENTEGFGHFPEVSLPSSGNMNFSDANSPWLSSALTQKIAAYFSQESHYRGLVFHSFQKGKWV